MMDGLVPAFQKMKPFLNMHLASCAGHNKKLKAHLSKLLIANGVHIENMLIDYHVFQWTVGRTVSMDHQISSETKWVPRPSDSLSKKKTLVMCQLKRHEVTC